MRLTDRERKAMIAALTFAISELDGVLVAQANVKQWKALLEHAEAFER